MDFNYQRVVLEPDGLLDGRVVFVLGVHLLQRLGLDETEFLGDFAVLVCREFLDEVILGAVDFAVLLPLDEEAELVSVH